MKITKKNKTKIRYVSPAIFDIHIFAKKNFRANFAENAYTFGSVLRILKSYFLF